MLWLLPWPPASRWSRWSLDQYLYQARTTSISSRASSAYRSATASNLRYVSARFVTHSPSLHRPGSQRRPRRSPEAV